ncbi:hypothetical protein LXA43DRAFT_150402 [Ganoderma leucocontextum]|nr:hypothetical protein LXA43DRAFT_150402 [Ganoderma leucocontextum]
MKIRINVLNPDVFIRASLGVPSQSLGEPPCLQLSTDATSHEPRFLLDALNASGICPDYEFMWSEDAFALNNGFKLGLYPLARDCFSTLNYPEYGASELSFAWFPNDSDPFDVVEEAFPTWDAESSEPVIDEILSHTARIAHFQHRICYFVVLVFGHRARLVRVDHSGIVITAKFPYAPSGGALTTFLWHFAHSSAAHRGHDASAQRVLPTSELGQRMLNRAALEAQCRLDDPVSQAFIESLDLAFPWWKLEIHDARAGRVCDVLVGKPHRETPGMVGSGTHGYVALGLADLDGPFVYLEDTWRPAQPADEREGNVLAELNAHGVPYVRTVLCHGDVPGQGTFSPNLVPMRGARHRHPMRPILRRHYRLVVKEMCMPIERFSNGLQLVKAVWCCMKAHEGAWHADVVHPNIHPDNISLHQTATGEVVGILGGWASTSDELEDRNPEKKETWMFASKHVLDDPTRTIDISDALESFFNVLLHLAVRFLPHNIPDAQAFIAAYFEASASDAQDMLCAGPLKSQAVTQGSLDSGLWFGQGGTVTFITARDGRPSLRANRHPLNDVFDEVLAWLRALYSLDVSPGSVKVLRLARNLESHIAMSNLLLMHMGRQGWPSDDKSHGDQSFVSRA